MEKKARRWGHGGETTRPSADGCVASKWHGLAAEPARVRRAEPFAFEGPNQRKEGEINGRNITDRSGCLLISGFGSAAFVWKRVC